MIPIGLGLAWAGYSLGIWGYCLVRGYNVSFMQCFKPTWPGKSGALGPIAQPTPTTQPSTNTQLTGG